jgi:uncharacterized membrane protein
MGAELMKKTNVSYITAMGLMMALVFISNWLSIPVPVMVGAQPSRIHFGNVFCLFSGLMFGPAGGGLAAGIGSALFDLSNPIYAASAPFTLVFKGVMAFVCGKIAYTGKHDGKNIKLNVTAGIIGILAYIVLYVSKSYISDVFFLRLPVPAALIDAGGKALTSMVNGIIAVIVAVPLCAAIRFGLERAGIFEKIRSRRA